MDFDTNLLRAFIAVKDTGSFTRAAQRLNLTQSAISHQIRRLEEQAGTPLLMRTTRSLTLTEDGEDFVRYADQVLRAQDALVRRFQRSSVSGVVRFGVPENFMGNRLPPLLSRFAHLFPEVRLDVTVDTYLNLQSEVDANGLDLAVVMSLSGKHDDGMVLRKTQFVWAAARSFEYKCDTPLPLAFAPEPCVHRQIGVKALDGADVKWRMAFTSPSQQGLRAAVLAGLAITAIPHSDLEPGMTVIDRQYGLPELPTAYFTLIWSRRGKTPSAIEFGNLLYEMAGVVSE